MKITIIEIDNMPSGTVSGSEAQKSKYNLKEDLRKAMAYDAFLMRNYLQYQIDKLKK